MAESWWKTLDNWKVQPSIDICSKECGAKCCRAPGAIVLTSGEAMRISEHTWRRVKVRSTTRQDMYILNFSENGNRCPALAPDNTCRIYDERPEGCRKFPVQPEKNCLVWPMEEKSNVLD